MGNAVCPMVASALGRCLALAAVGDAPESMDEAVVSVPDPDFQQVMGSGVSFCDAAWFAVSPVASWKHHHAVYLHKKCCRHQQHHKA